MASTTAASQLRIFVIGGHGKIALAFTRLAVDAGHQVRSQIRQPEHSSDLPTGATQGSVQPLVESLETLSVPKLSEIFREHDPNVIVFAAGAGGKGGQDRTRAVDQEGAIKVFDAIEESGLGHKESFRRLLLISAIDIRDASIKPDWYTDADFEVSRRARAALGAYFEAKYQADKNLHTRTSFPWAILRPTQLLDEEGSGKVALGEHSHIGIPVPRKDVALTLLAFAELPRGQGDGLALDLTGGSKNFRTAVADAVKRNRSDWIG